MVLEKPSDYMEYAKRHLEVGNYKVGISSIDSAIETSNLPKGQLHLEAARAFLKLAKKLDLEGEKDAAQTSLFIAKKHYINSENSENVRLARWDNYLYSNDKRDIQSEEI